ncbi:MAG: ABC transporter permease [Caulobacter sp.]|nr:ABC transporter permease [Caulobacter sp.]
MRRADLVTFAARAIIAHPTRSALTSLGVVIGVAAVVMMTSIGLGAQQRVTSAIGGLGSNLLIVSPGASRGPGGGFVSQGAGSGMSLTEDDAKAIADQVDGAIAVAPAVRGGAQLTAEGANWQSRVEGVTPDYLVARDLTIASGRMFDEAESRQGRKVIVIGQTIATELFGENVDPVGKRIRVGAAPFEVIGVLTPKGQSGFGQDQDDIVLGPLRAVRSRVVGRRVQGTNVQTVYVKAGEADDLDRLQEDVTNLLRERHRIRQGAEDDFSVQNMASIMEAMQASVKTFTSLLAAVAAVSLVVGGVGIMNIMLVAVTERTREIGLRMAVGAKRNDVLFQFALEAMTLSVIGGIIGLIVGIGGGFLMARLGEWPVAIAGWSIPVSLGFSLLVGLVFGAYPSWRAARLDPIEALRRE